MIKKTIIFLTLLTMLSGFIFAQQSIYTPYKQSNVEFSPVDFGKMWTFDNFPYDYIKSTYDLELTKDWLEDTRLSALQFANGCSGAFVSADGLIMTNHHCARDAMVSTETEGEDLLKTGFYAETMDIERKVPGLFVDQLVLMKDLTNEILATAEESDNNSEKIRLVQEKIKSLEESYSTETGLVCQVVTLYNGTKYTLHGYRRYNDIRLVMAPEFQIASTGWDWDNFTYPRYELDFMFFRAYENDKPVTVKNYFEWSKNGASEDEPIFVVGRPGNTDRQLSVSHLEYLRDTQFKALLLLFNGVYNANRELYDKYPDRESELLNRVMSMGNARKVYAGRIQGLSDEYLLSLKKNFETDLQSKIDASPELKAKYGNLFNSINNVVEELRSCFPGDWAYRTFRFSKAAWFDYAEQIIKIAEQKKLSEDEREEGYSDDDIEENIETLANFAFDSELNHLLLQGHAEYLYYMSGKESDLYSKMYGGLSGFDAAEYALGHSYFSTPENLKIFLNEDPDFILNSDDPFIHFVQFTRSELPAIMSKKQEAMNTLTVLNQQLGMAITEVYGTTLPPDATSTLRITDGVIEGYEYNGTIAPGITTFYGLYDRFNSFDGATYPWGLPEKWKVVPEGMDLSTPLNIASTNDIVGGNSGSSVINQKGEVVGLVFDGNMESLWGSYVFMPSKNRSIAVDSRGIMASLEYVYKTERLINELKNGKLID
ncbi:MAG: hypothetical protein SCALA702_28010 [Melioribacteraceae bacterium]|nr:MAG: hypothetical protein SCALA702_28010 [Melioribacteraceae bacterium]